MASLLSAQQQTYTTGLTALISNMSLPKQMVEDQIVKEGLIGLGAVGGFLGIAALVGRRFTEMYLLASSVDGDTETVSRVTPHVPRICSLA